MESSFSQSVTTAIAAMKSSFKLIGVNTERPPGSRGRLRNFTLQTLAAFANSLFPNGPLTSVTVANTGTPDGVANITGQVTDESGNAVAGRFLVRVYLSATSGGAATDLGTLTAKTNTVLIKEDTDDAFASIMTHTDGSWGLSLDTATNGNVFAHAAVTGKIAIGNAAITGN